MTIEQAMRELYQRHLIRYRWYAGMRVLAPELGHGRVLVGGERGGIKLIEWESAPGRKTWSPGDCTDPFMIDVVDSATAGVLHEVAEEAYGKPLELRYNRELRMYAVFDNWTQMGAVGLFRGQAYAEVIKNAIPCEESEP